MSLYMYCLFAYFLFIVSIELSSGVHLKLSHDSLAEHA